MSLVFKQKITLDLTISRVQNIHCSQDDADSRNILITLSDNGKPYTIPSDVSIFLKVSKPDNTFVYIDEYDTEHLYKNDDGTISVLLPEQTTAVPGICESEIQLINKTTKEVVSTAKFNIIVKKSVLSDKEIESSIDSNIVKKMIYHLVDFMNPHKVNKEQVGLGNVPNVTTNDQTPTYDEAEKFENIESGETISTAFGKIKKAISTLIGHIKTKATTEQEGHVKLTNSVSSESVDTAATPSSVKKTYDKVLEEEERAKQSESDLNTAISNETNRAKGVENELVTNLNVEIDRATKAETSHFTDYDNPHKTTQEQVGLGNVDNTSDANKPVSTAQQKAIDDAYANSNKYTDKKIADLINGAPETLDTLKEVADAIEESKTVEEALNKAIGTKANQSELDTHTGNNTIHITSDERTNWNDANDKKHTHENKSVLDSVTTEKVGNWDQAFAHTSDAEKHITQEERNLWNDVSDKIEIIKITEFPTEDIQVYPTIYALISTDRNGKQSGVLYEYKNGEWIMYGGSTEGVGFVELTYQEYQALSEEDKNADIVYVVTDASFPDGKINAAVTGVKGNAETEYRQGDINLTPANIGAVAVGGDTAENITTFTSSDVADGSVSSWTSVPKLTSGEKHSSIFAKVSQMFKNIRYLYKMLGTTDISKIGDGTATGAISTLNDSFTTFKGNMSHIQSSNIDKTQVGVPNNTQTLVNKLTVENDGVYLIHAQCAFVASSTGYRDVSIKITSKTGVIVNRGNANAVALPSPIPTCIQCQSITAVSLQEGDAVGLYANQNSGSALNVSASYIVIIRLK